MKTIVKLIMFCVLFCGFSNLSKAQEVENPQEAFANMDWYLTKIVIDAEEFLFIPTGSIPYSLLETYELEVQNENVSCYFWVDYCEMCATDAYFINSTEFKIFGWGDCLGDNNCMYNNNPDVFEFSHLYESVFWNRTDTSDSEESFYEISINETNSNLSMVITKENGNKAYYSDEPLSIPSLEKNEIILYPNPVKDHLYIENLTENVQFVIYDLSGKVLLSQELNEATKQVNLSQLLEGIYLYQLSQNGQKIKIGKLVKN